MTDFINNKMTEPVKGCNNKIFSIDILRGIASIMVLIHHYKHFFLPATSIKWTTDDIVSVPNFEIWAPAYYWGLYAVQFFWVLSGFVFMHVYANKISVTSKKFFLSRFARLYPLHFITLITVALIQ